MMQKRPSPIDQYVGARVRVQRQLLEMSQTKLGDALGLTFQQIQKYEKGANRIGASRLQQIAHILQVPVSFFFEGAPNIHPKVHHHNSDAPSLNFVTDFLALPDGLALISSFIKIKDPRLKRSIVNLVSELSTRD
jgi:transcriptional regulator with XRE-family HTH domain